MVESKQYSFIKENSLDIQMQFLFSFANKSFISSRSVEVFCNKVFHCFCVVLLEEILKQLNAVKKIIKIENYPRLME